MNREIVNFYLDLMQKDIRPEDIYEALHSLLIRGNKATDEECANAVNLLLDIYDTASNYYHS